MFTPTAKETFITFPDGKLVSYEITNIRPCPIEQYFFPPALIYFRPTLTVILIFISTEERW